MPQLLKDPVVGADSAASTPNKKKKNKSIEKEVVVYNCDGGAGQRLESSTYTSFFKGSSIAEYLVKRKQYEKISDIIEREGERLEVEDPEKLKELQEELSQYFTIDLPTSKHKRYPNTPKELRDPGEKSPEPDEFTELSDAERVKLEAMFAEMENENYGMLVERDDESDEDGYSDIFPRHQGALVAEADNNQGKKKELHFSRWDKDPSHQKQQKEIAKKEKFKPRLNVVWQRRLENSKLEKGKKAEPNNALAPPPSTSFFNSLMAKKKKVVKSKLPSIVVSENEKHEPTNLEIKNPRQNRSSELRLQQRMLKETMLKMGTAPNRLSTNKLTRSQSQNNINKKNGGSMRRASSLRNLSAEDKKAREGATSSGRH